MSFFLFYSEIYLYICFIKIKNMGYIIIIGIYLLGYIIHYRMFMKQEDHIVDGWALVTMGLFFSLLSWVAVLLTFLLECKSEPPRWLTLKKK